MFKGGYFAGLLPGLVLWGTCGFSSVTVGAQRTPSYLSFGVLCLGDFLGSRLLGGTVGLSFRLSPVFTFVTLSSGSGWGETIEYFVVSVRSINSDSWGSVIGSGVLS